MAHLSTKRRNTMNWKKNGFFLSRKSGFLSSTRMCVSVVDDHKASGMVKEWWLQIWVQVFVGFFDWSITGVDPVCDEIPSFKHTKSYWKWLFIVDLPMKNGGSFHSYMMLYVSLPEGNEDNELRNHWVDRATGFLGLFFVHQRWRSQRLFLHLRLDFIWYVYGMFMRCSWSFHFNLKKKTKQLRSHKML